jgi:hypothetical protein
MEEFMEFRHRFLPYCIKSIGDGRYIVLNRLYKPLGHIGEWVNYATHPSAVTINIPPAAAQSMSWNGSTGIDAIYLYSDDVIPTASAENWHLYAERLHYLAHLKLV